MPASWPSIDDGTFLRLILRAPPFDAVVFASTSAVNLFVDRCTLAGVTPEQVSRRDVFAVGDRTRRELERRGIRVAESPGEFSGTALAAMLAARNLRGKRFLFPRGDIGRDEVIDAVRGAGAECQPLVLYHTKGPEPAEAAEARARTLRREFDVVTFASPSAVRNFAGLFFSPGAPHSARSRDDCGDRRYDSASGGRTGPAGAHQGRSLVRQRTCRSPCPVFTFLRD